MNNKGYLVAAITLFALLFTLFSFVAFSKSTPSVSARAFALYEPTTESFICGENIDTPLPMASTTKIMTALVALRCGKDLNEVITISKDAVGIEGSSAYFKGGECYTMLDLITILLLRSANDAACQIALSVSGSLENFATLMNSTAEELGLTGTSFTNPAGLDDKNHYTTARDLSLLTAEALKNETFRNIVSSYKYTATDITSGNKTLFVNHNKLLKRYDGCIGVKTGFTNKSGRCLVSAASKEGVTLIAVTLNAPDDWNDHTKILDFGFNSVSMTEVVHSGEYCYKIPTLGAHESCIYAKNTENLSLPIDKTGKIEVIPTLPTLLNAPVSAGEAVGYLTVKYNGRAIAKVDIEATTSANEVRGLFDRFTQK